MANTPVTPTPVPAWPTAPQRTDAPATFVTLANAWVAATSTQTTAMNTLGTNVKFNADSAFASASEAFDSATESSDSAAESLEYSVFSAGSANLAGAWADQTGAVAPPYSVTHVDRIWVLLNSLGDVTASEPGVTADWLSFGVLTAGVGFGTAPEQVPLNQYLGDLAFQSAEAVVLSGGTINATAIGATTPGTGAFTTISASGEITANGGIAATALSVVGDVTVSGGVYLGGAVAANLLNDYEEGTWTPVISDAITGGNTATGNTIAGFYTKVGNIVTISAVLINIDTSGMTSESDLVIRDLPFTSFSGNAGRAEGSLRADQVTFSGQIAPNIEINDSYIKLAQTVSATSDIFLTVSAISSGSSDIFLSMTYYS